MTKSEYNGPFTKKSAFTHKHTHPLLLDLLLIRRFKVDYLEWEPETCWAEIQQEFGTTVSDLNRTKIQATKTCHLVDMPYERWNLFEKVAVSFSGLTPKFDLIQKPTPHACAFAVDTMSQIRDKKISDEVYRYIAAVLLADGICYAPSPLDPCNEHLAKFVPQDMQRKTKLGVERRLEPTFDGTRDEDIQVFKSTSVADFVEYERTQLLRQIEVVIGE